MSNKRDNAPGRLGGTRRGVGIDPVRPPAPIEPGSRKLKRPVGVAVFLPDPLERSNLARALVAASCSVTPCLQVGDVRAEDVGEVEVVVADFDAPNALALVDALRSIHAELPAIAWTRRVALVQKGLEAATFGRYEVLDRSSRTPALIEAVRRLVGA